MRWDTYNRVTTPFHSLELPRKKSKKRHATKRESEHLEQQQQREKKQLATRATTLPLSVTSTAIAPTLVSMASSVSVMRVPSTEPGVTTAAADSQDPPIPKQVR